MNRLFRIPNLKWQLSLACSLLIFGFLITTQYRTQIELGSSLTNQRTEDLVTIVKSLNEKRTKLEKEQTDLEKNYQTLLEKVQAGTSLYNNLDKEIKQLQIATGAVAIAGPGITVTISGDSNLIATDLVDIINELWVTGAEAVAINDIRINAYTTIQESAGKKGGFVISVNGDPLLYPVVIKAIGDADTLEKGLTFTGGIIDNLSTLYKVYPKIKQETSLVIPTLKETPSFEYMHKMSNT